jgi:hypothetical protein
VAFNKLDVSSGAQARADVSATNVTDKGFTIRVASWLASKIWSAGVSWVATVHPQVEIGTWLRPGP